MNSPEQNTLVQGALDKISPNEVYFLGRDSVQQPEDIIINSQSEPVSVEVKTSEKKNSRFGRMVSGAALSLGLLLGGSIPSTPEIQPKPIVSTETLKPKERLNLSVPKACSLTPEIGVSNTRLESVGTLTESNDFYDYLIEELDKQDYPWIPTENPVFLPEFEENICEFQEERIEIDILEEDYLEVSIPENVPISYRIPLTITQEAKNQGACKSCGAFTLSETLRMQYMNEKGLHFDPSEAYIFFCRTYITSQDILSCATGHMSHLSYLTRAVEYGYEIVDEECFPYGDAVHGVDLDCDNVCVEPEETMSIFDYKYLERKQSALINYMSETGNPIPVGMRVYESFYYYESGIYYGQVGPEDKKVGAHGVVIIGYDLNDGEDGTWLVRNSWGSDWGEDGNFRMAMGPDDDFIGGFCSTSILVPINPYVIRDRIYLPLITSSLQR